MKLECLLSLDGAVLRKSAAERRWACITFPCQNHRIIDMYTGEWAGDLATPNSSDQLAVFSRSSVLVGARMGPLRLIEVDTGHILCELESTPFVPFTALCVTQSTHYALAISFYGGLTLWDLNTGKCLNQTSAHVIICDWHLFPLAVSVDGKWAASGGATGDVRVWDCGTLAHVDCFHAGVWHVNSVAISDNGDSIFAGCWDKSIPLAYMVRGIKGDRGRALNHFDGYKGHTYPVEISSDGRWGIAPTEDGWIRFFDFVEGKEFYRTKVHEEVIYNLRWSSDGTRLLTGAGKTVKLWAVEW